MVPVLVDWITVSHRDWTKHEHMTPVLVPRLCGGNPTPSKHRAGARGWRGNRSFVGVFDNGMLLIEATGSAAQSAADTIDKLISSDGMSVARIDLQATFWVADADAIIRTIVPSRRYRCTQVMNVYERGCTLYVGSPSSDARLRIYNKSVESGQHPPEGGEWLRVEIQLRNKYADRAWISWRKRAQNGLLLEYVRKMLDERTYRLVRDAIEHGDEPIFDEDLEDDWLCRRLYWLEHTVVPALRKLALHDDYAREQVRLAFCDIIWNGRIKPDRDGSDW